MGRKPPTSAPSANRRGCPRAPSRRCSSACRIRTPIPTISRASRARSSPRCARSRASRTSPTSSSTTCRRTGLVDVEVAEALPRLVPQPRRVPRGLHARHRQAARGAARAALLPHRRLLVPRGGMPIDVFGMEASPQGPVVAGAGRPALRAGAAEPRRRCLGRDTARCMRAARRLSDGRAEQHVQHLAHVIEPIGLGEPRHGPEVLRQNRPVGVSGRNANGMRRSSRYSAIEALVAGPRLTSTSAASSASHWASRSPCATLAAGSITVAVAFQVGPQLQRDERLVLHDEDAAAAGACPCRWRRWHPVRPAPPRSCRRAATGPLRACLRPRDTRRGRTRSSSRNWQSMLPPNSGGRRPQDRQSKSWFCGRQAGGPPTFAPHEPEPLLRLTASRPRDLDGAARTRQRAVLDCVGRELVHEERESLSVLRTQREPRPAIRMLCSVPSGTASGDRRRDRRGRRRSSSPGAGARARATSPGCARRAPPRSL